MQAPGNRAALADDTHVTDTASAQHESSTIPSLTGSEAERELPIFAAGRAAGGGLDAPGLHPQRPSFAFELTFVLAVDDEEMVRKALAWMFKAIGVPVRGATNATEAFRIVSASTPELAIVDLKLERGDPQSGLAVIASLRKQFPEMMIGAITGLLTDQLTADSLAAGANWVLDKSFDRPKLLDTILVHRPPSPRILRVDLPLDEVSDLYIERVMKAEGGSKSATARAIKRKRSSLQRRLNRKR